MVRQRNGIYVYKLVQLPSFYALGSVCFVYCELWHIRLRHPSDSVVNKFLKKSSLNVSKNFGDRPCNICVRANQTRDHFPLSMNKAIEIFCLIYCDLWESYKTMSTSGVSYFFKQLWMIFLERFGYICLLRKLWLPLL